MPEYLSPGVYIEEIEIGARPIEGVSTSTAGFLGEAERGPTTPRLVTSWLDYQRVFGGCLKNGKYIPIAVKGFFENGGQRCYIGRIVKSGDVAATTAMLKLTSEGVNALTVEAVGEGIWGNHVAIKVTPGSINGFKLSIFYWKKLPSSLYDPEKDLKSIPRPSASEVYDNLSVDDASPDYYEKRVNGISNFIRIIKKAADSGEMPDVGHSATAQGGTALTVTLASSASSDDDVYNDMQIEITGGTGIGQIGKIIDYDGTTKVATVESDWGPVPDDTSNYRIVGEVHKGTAQGGATSTITLAADASSDDDAYNDMQIVIVDGTGNGQDPRTITDYDGSTKEATVDTPWDTVPDNTSVYRIDLVHEGVAQSGTAPIITLSNNESNTDDAFNWMQIEITAGTGSGQIRKIIDYDGTSKEASVNANWLTLPDNTSVYYLSWPMRTLKNGSNSLVHTGTAQIGTNSTITLANDASADDDAYNNMQIEITAGTGSGQIRKITDYTGASKEAKVEPNWDVNPDETSQYRVTDPTPELVLADYERTDSNQPGKRKGLTGFKEVDDISIVYSPNPYVVNGLVGALITHCETLKDRFAIIDAEQGSSNVSELDPRSNNETKYAAFYYPWIKIIDPETGLQRLVPPGGHMAGIYARSDIERGVHKAPANEVVKGARKLEFKITKGEQDVLNPRGVNCIRAFPGRGIRIWGARTLSSNTLWKYINVRRLFLYLEESIEEGTQWVVFEPNDEKLWARVKQTITQFLTRVWRDGALMGTTAEEAFFVKCDRTTMTQDDIDNGRLIVLIGVAPVKPAEFVIFRIAQWTGGSEVTE